MKKMTKVIVIALAMALGTVALVGCGAKYGDDKPIKIVTREQGSGTKDGFMEYATGDKATILPKGAITARSTAEVLSNVKTNPQAIGYDSFGYITKDVKMLTLEGVSVQDDAYPLARFLTVIYKSNKIVGNHAAEKFLEYIGSSDVTDKINEGYQANHGDLQHDIPYQKEDGLGGKVVVEGSTSLSPLMESLAEMYKSVQKGVEVTVISSGSGPGRDAIRDGKADLGMVSAELSQSQIDDIAKGDDPSVVVSAHIAYDKIAVIVNKLNTHDNITQLQLNKIYNSNETGYKNWAEMYA
ncbi:MAG: substrate-binding domain-containing protein [Firmicutes bacterium]|nr:substrate-binding domain-containing protein [Bacillota bacterium]